MVRPILPVVEYYINYDYINEQLCENRDKPYLKCNGTCYLEKQLDKIDPQHPNQKPVSALVFDLKEYPVSPLDFDVYQRISFDELFVLSKICTQEQNHSSLFITNIFRPPISA